LWKHGGGEVEIWVGEALFSLSYSLELIIIIIIIINNNNNKVGCFSLAENFPSY
jgi:hypothetical protein